MDDLRSILLTHAVNYPQMQPTDAVKLLYQSEFGGGHLIRDEQQCLRYLKQEYSQTPQVFSGPLTEQIGNGMVRVYLNSLDAHGYTIDALGADFIRSARVPTGSVDSFRKKLALLQQLAKEGLLPFPFEALEPYLEEYAKAGYPMVSHSPQYRAAYHPAYRVMQQEYLTANNRH